MIERAGLGGGCHWCTEAVFQSVRGVQTVAQGFVAAPAPDDALSEAVMVDFDRSAVTLADLLAVHVATHSARSDHHLRGKYRSAAP